MRELISIQIGSYSNFIGSHFWNFQDELIGLQGDPTFSDCGVDFDRLYRVGETPHGVATYTPRLLAIDSRGSLGAVQAAGSLYEQHGTAPTMAWEGQASRHVAEPHPKNKFLQSLEQEELEWKSQQEAGKNQSGADDRATNNDTQQSIVRSLDDSVQFWTDFSKVHFHPLSLYELEGVWHGVTPLDDFGSGIGLLKGLEKEEIVDRLRFFVEEADQMQGLQVVVDDSNGFASVAADLLETVVDDYDKSPILLFTARSPASSQKMARSNSTTLRGLHDVVSFSQLSSYTQCLIPLGVSSFANFSRNLNVDDRKDFHTSAVYAAAWNCVTLPFRLRELSVRPSAVSNQTEYGGIDMASLVHLLMGQRRRRVSILDVSMPAQPSTDARKHRGFFEFMPLVSDVADENDDTATEVLVSQGSPLEDVESRTHHGSHRAYTRCPLVLPLPFPSLFNPTGKEVIELGSDVSSLPIASRLRSSSAVVPYLDKRLQTLQNLHTGTLGWQILGGWGIGKDEIQELVELNSNLIAAYKNAESSESDPD